MIKKTVLLAFSILFLSGCTLGGSTTKVTTQTQTEQTDGKATDSGVLNQQNPTNSTSSADKNKGVLPLTSAELTKHNQPNDCWLLISGKVYDVTAYIGLHPGGETILAGCGSDATNLFATMGSKNQPHSAKAEQLLKSYYLGNLIVQ